MKPVVIYSSRTGNTKKVAEAVLSVLPEGTPMVAASDVGEMAEYDLVFMGYWVNKGTADTAAQEAMRKISGKMVAIFATAGTYPDSEHAQKSLKAGATCLGEGCMVLGTFICQGAVDPERIERAKMRPPDHRHPPTAERIKRWQDASTHPDDTDLENAVAFTRAVVQKANRLSSSKIEPETEPVSYTHLRAHET